MNVNSICSCSNAQPSVRNDGFNQLFSDFKGIGSAIQSGDLTSAQNALSTFQTDLQNNTGNNPLSRLFSKNSNLNDDLKSLSDALSSNDPAKAQDAFKTLIKDMQTAMRTMRSHGHHRHHHVDNDGDSDDGGSSTTSTTASTTSSSSETSSTSDSTTGGSLNVQA